MKNCTLCQELKPLDEFNKKATSLDGKQNVCRDCNRARSRQYYKENHDKHRKVIAERKHIYKGNARAFIFEYLNTHPCVDCGVSDVRVLEFDHLPGVDKLDGVARLASNGRSIEVLQAEIDKCEVRCRNCHQIKTFERMGGTWHDKLIASLEE